MLGRVFLSIFTAFSLLHCGNASQVAPSLTGKDGAGYGDGGDEVQPLDQVPAADLELADIGDSADQVSELLDDSLDAIGPAGDTSPSQDPDGQDPDNGDDSTGDGAVDALADSGFVPSEPCTSSAACSEAGNVCVSGWCWPKILCTSEVSCKAMGFVCDKPAGACVQCVADADCDAGQICKARQCIAKPTPCQSNSDCQAGYLCDPVSKGCVQCLASANCAAGYYCVESLCLSQLCLAGSSKCKTDAVAQVCTADGNAWTTQPCSAGQQCIAGNCLNQVCKSGDVLCADATTLAVCKADGTGYTKQDCPAQTACTAGSCQALVCTPGQMLCKSSTSVTCNPDGTGYIVGPDCAASGKVCLGGSCVVNPSCQPGTTQCSGKNLMICKADGSGWTAQNCDDGNVCTVGDSCSVGSCIPGKLLDKDGDGFASIACGGSDCNDDNAAISPKASEVCIPLGIDDNCNGQTDEGCSAVGCNQEGVACAGGKGLCKSGHCLWTDVLGSQWTLVPAGDVALGCNAALDSACAADEKPQHIATLTAFWVAVTEVTVKQYQACVTSKVCSPPLSGGFMNWNVPSKVDNPVDGITFSQAAAICTWLGGALPTEAQWEKAARGGCETVAGDCAKGTRTYPWGNAAPVCGQTALFAACSAFSTYPVGVGSSQGASPYGAEDMAGNVWEWTQDWYDAAFYAKAGPANPVNGQASGVRVMRGGGASAGAALLRASARAAVDPQSTAFDLGVRCVQPL